MINLQNIKFALLAPLVTLGALASVWWMQHTLAMRGAELSARLQTIADQESFENQFKALQSNLQETQAEREAISTFILQDNNDTIALLSKLDSVARSLRVEFSTGELKVVELATGNYDEVHMGFEVEGRETAVMDMVALLHVLPYHAEVRGFSLRRLTDPDTGAATAIATVNIVVSIQKVNL